MSINTFSFRFIFIRSCYPAHFHRILFICLYAHQQHNLYFLLLDNIILCALFLCNITVLVCNISIAIWQHFSICIMIITNKHENINIYNTSLCSDDFDTRKSCKGHWKFDKSIYASGNRRKFTSMFICASPVHPCTGVACFRTNFISP